jgi:acylglycerol lipase
MLPALSSIEFYPASGCRRLAVRVWRAPRSPRARVVFVHGITSHGGWYSKCAEFLATQGFEVAFLDRRGSGLNGTAMGDVGDWHTWLDDVAAFVRHCPQPINAAGEASRLPNILCGISWGGKLAAAVARQYPTMFAGVVFICPGIYSPFLPGFAKRSVLALPAPRWLQQRRVRIPLRDPALFTDMPQWQDFIATDPLALRTATWRFAQQDRKLTRYAREASTFLHLPTLMLLAGQDRIVDNRRTRKFFAQIPSHQKTLIEYHGAGHTLEFEPEPSAYFQDLVRWIGMVAEQNVEWAPLTNDTA